jgi:hypothetical protein
MIRGSVKAMSSGDVVVLVHTVMPPATAFAAVTVRAGGSTPAEQVPVYAFDAAADEYMDFYCTLTGYAGGGLTFTLATLAATATTGGALLALALRRLTENTEDVDTAHTYDYNEIRVVCASAAGAVVYDTIPFTDGADMDSVATGESFILRVRRRGTNATAGTGDDMAGDLQVLGFTGRET